MDVKEEAFLALKDAHPHLEHLVYSASPFSSYAPPKRQALASFPAYPAELQVLLMPHSMQGVQTHTVDSDVILFGRRCSGRDGIQIADPMIGRMHTRLIHYCGEHYIIDLGSTNGTHLGEHKLTPGCAAQIDYGENIRLGESTIRVER